jgi:hypothetical protein
MVAVRPAGASAFEYPTRLSSAAGIAGEPQIAAAGAATLVLWTQNADRCKQRVLAAVRPAGGAFSTALAVSSDYRAEQSECSFGAGQLALAGSDHAAIAGWVQNSALHIATLTG